MLKLVKMLKWITMYRYIQVKTQDKNSKIQGKNSNKTHDRNRPVTLLLNQLWEFWVSSIGDI